MRPVHPAMTDRPVRHLVVVLGDQLDPSASAFDGCDPALDAIWMAEVEQESTHVWSAKARIALFLSAMRHFAQDRRADGWAVHYRCLDDADNRGTLGAELAEAILRLRPQTVRITAPGDWRVLQMLRETAAVADVPLVIECDRHFYCDVRAFAAWARTQPELRLEMFYRHQHAMPATQMAIEHLQPQLGLRTRPRGECADIAVEMPVRFDHQRHVRTCRW